MRNGNTVICRNCSNYSAQLSDCSVWLLKIYDPDSTSTNTTTLWHQLGRLSFEQQDTPRICQHFIGQYPFTVGE